MELPKNEPKVNSKFQWFLFAGVIPFFLVVSFALVILTILGVNVFDATKVYGQHIPGISMLFKNEEATISIEEKLRKDISDLESTANDQGATMTKMEKEVEQKQQEIEGLIAEIELLTKELKTKEEQQQDTKTTLIEITTMYESMSAQNAAAILTELNDEDALNIVRSLSPEALGSIFEKMIPADAAYFTEQLTQEATNQ